MSCTITAVCNEFRRPELLGQQLLAIDQQTAAPSEILVWRNYADSGMDAVGRSMQRVSTRARQKRASASANFGVWARFAYALNATSEYVAVFDDDTIPGPRWFEHCLRSMDDREALLGASGVVHPDGRWSTMRKHGWQSQNASPVEVDYVGHAWFFKRSWLSVFWRELPPPGQTLCGEDMHFSFMLQRYLGIPTTVPPHPADDRSVWGSVRGELGQDDASIWESNPVDAGGARARDAMEAVFTAQRSRGWRLVSE